VKGKGQGSRGGQGARGQACKRQWSRLMPFLKNKLLRLKNLLKKKRHCLGGSDLALVALDEIARLTRCKTALL